MNILITPNNLYAGYAGVLLTSIFENSDKFFHVYILTTGFNQENINKMKILADRYKQTIEIIKLSNEDAHIPVPGRWGISIYIKLLAPKYINVDTILYLDIDIIVTGDLGKIEEFDISEYYAAIPPDVALSENHKARLGIPSSNFYGCCGVVYINLKKWREENLTQKFFDYLQKNYDIIKFADQDIINPVCTGKILELPMRYNLMAYFFLNKPLILPKYFSILPHEINKAVIIHYTCIKPWFSDCDFPLKHLFHIYAKKSPWNIKYTYSPNFSIKRFFITKIRYFIQSTGIKTYPYLFQRKKNIKINKA